MYIPSINLMSDNNEILSFIKRFSFGTIITTCEDGRPMATHLPFLVEENNGGLILLSHFAKANPQWQQIAGNNNILVIFQEPHAYISPSNYEKDLNVPTWNYIAIHMYGEGSLITDEAAVEQLLNLTIETYEPAQLPKHNALPEDYKQKLSKGIVAFAIKVTAVDAKKKLSQNKTQTEQANIIDTLKKSTLTTDQQIAEYMQQNLQQKSVEKP